MAESGRRAPLWREGAGAGAGCLERAVAAAETGGGGGVEARADAGGGKGRGLFWRGPGSLAPGTLVFRERPLAAVQHAANRAAAPCCQRCHRFIGGGESLLAACLRGDVSPAGAAGGASGSAGGINPPQLPRWEAAMAVGDFAPPATGIPCRGGCGIEFCGVLCEEEAWTGAHGLLCPGGGLAAPWEEALSAARAEELEEEGLAAAAPRKRARPDGSDRRYWAAAFRDHAAATNDALALAGICIADVLARARDRLVACSTSSPKAADEALLWAWEPYGLGWKALWWECVPCPPEEAEEDGGEPAFRAALRQLAGDSALLLRHSLYDARFAPLFTDEVLGALVGMFELNNLDVVVSNPLARYFRYMEDLPGEAEGGDASAGADKATAADLGALVEQRVDDGVDCHCSGTGFFRAQSLMNHSCEPNCAAQKGDADADNAAMLYSLKPIQPGEELTISYIEERDEDGELLPAAERRMLLQDYGFECRCPLCVAEGVRREGSGGGR